MGSAIGRKIGFRRKEEEGNMSDARNLCLAAAGIALLAFGCGGASQDMAVTAEVPADPFQYDPAEVPGATPWTGENFRNDPSNFQFAVIGDRGGGANPSARRTFQRRDLKRCFRRCRR